MRGTKMRAPAVLSAGAILALLAGVVAGAEPSPSPAPAPSPPPAKGAQAPASADTKHEPIDITADHGELFNEERRAVYTGDVESIWGQDRMRTPQMTIFFAKKGEGPAPPKPPAGAGAEAGSNFGKIERIEAEGTVFFTTPTQNARGDHATYLAVPDTVTLTGNVVLVQDKNVSTGDKLVIDRKTNHATLFADAGAKRVRGVFYQEDTANTPAGGAKGPAKPAAGRAPS